MYKTHKMYMFLKQIKKVNIFIRKMSISEILCTTAKTKKI